MKKYILFILFNLLVVFSFAQVEVKNPLCENRNNPVGLDVLQPRLSWQLISANRNTRQNAYAIRVAENVEDVVNGKNLVWNSGKIVSDRSVHVRYSGNTLQSAKKYFWQVMVWDNHGKSSSWSEPSFWQMGFLKSSDWKAKWIKAGYEEDTVLRPSPLLRKTFTAIKKIQSATAFITSHGVYESFINGQRIGDAFLTPGFTSYNKRLQYQVYDVTNFLQPG